MGSRMAAPFLVSTFLHVPLGGWPSQEETDMMPGEPYICACARVAREERMTEMNVEGCMICFVCDSVLLSVG